MEKIFREKIKTKRKFLEKKKKQTENSTLLWIIWHTPWCAPPIHSTSLRPLF